jgi:triacylglycerol lipase
MSHVRAFSRLATTLASAGLMASCQAPRNLQNIPGNPLQGQAANFQRFNTDDAANQGTAARTGFENFTVVSTTQGQTWPRMELLRTAGLPTARMPQRGRQQAADVVTCFGQDRPPSSDVCLHDAGAPDSLRHEVPVLLIHGANMNATSNWAAPPFTRQKTGLMQHLRAQGYHVFAVSFADKHDDNFVWVNQIHNAIERIRQITGAQEVDTVAHSKGGFALRMYTSNIMGPGMQRPYQKHVRKAIFVGTPHRGIDYTFRNSVVHWALLPAGDDPVKYAPVAWDKTLLLGTWKDTREESFMGPYFKGQAQMMARWDKEYPINPTNPDWYTTYNGGQGFVSHSPGIDAVIQSGGDIVGQLKQSPVEAGIQVALLAGKRANMEGLLNESSGPSDGIVFVKSASAAQDVTAGGARLLDSKVLDLHHLGLVAEPEALAWIDAQLSR